MTWPRGSRCPMLLCFQRLRNLASRCWAIFSGHTLAASAWAARGRQDRTWTLRPWLHHCGQGNTGLPPTRALVAPPRLHASYGAFAAPPACTQTQPQQRYGWHSRGDDIPADPRTSYACGTLNPAANGGQMGNSLADLRTAVQARPIRKTLFTRWV